MMNKFKQRCNQKGFTLVELMVVIAILGILAAIAIPKFSDSTTLANTAKIQADLRTLDSAIVQYEAQEGQPPTALSKLVDNKLIVAIPTKPKGSFYILAAQEAQSVGALDYALGTTGDAKGRAVFGTTYTSEQIGKAPKTPTP